MGKESKLDVGDIWKGKPDDLRFKNGDRFRVATYNNDKYILARLIFDENKACLYGKINEFEQVRSKKFGRKDGQLVWDIKSNDAFFVPISDITWEDSEISEDTIRSLM